MAITINDENYKEVLAAGKPVVVDCWASWCGPCKAMSPIIDELATEFDGRVTIAKYNCDEDNDLATDYGVMSLPTLLFFKDGQLIDRHAGSIARDALTARINALL